MELTNPDVLKFLLQKHGFRFSKSMGQNFLIKPWVPQEIADSAELTKDFAVMEVGAGVGCLTHELALRAGKVVCVELDTALKPILDETLAEHDNIEIVYGDVLKQDLRKLVDEKMEGLRPAICANLPYNVTSPLLQAFIEAERFESITVMIQREVAIRLAAKPGNGDYGAFTIYVQWHCEVERLFDVEPECFMPAPKVTSSVIRLVPRKEPPCYVKDEKLMFKIVRASFNQRRKTLLNGLTNGLSGYTKEEIIEAMEACGLDLRVRGETLDIFMFAELANTLVK